MFAVPAAGLMFPALFGMIFLGFPIAFSLIAVAFLFGLGIFGAGFGNQLFGRVVDVAGNFVLIQIPLFVFMGALFESSSIATRLFTAMRVWVGRSPGGLAQAVIIMCAIFSASSGTVGACEIVVGLMAIPAMLKAGYRKDLISGTICGGGSLGTIIPPSVTVVVYATVADLPMGDVIAGTVFPGLINTGLFMLYIYIRCRLRPQDGPPLPAEELADAAKRKALAAAHGAVSVRRVDLCGVGDDLYGHRLADGIGSHRSVGNAAIGDRLRRFLLAGALQRLRAARF